MYLYIYKLIYTYIYIYIYISRERERITNIQTEYRNQSYNAKGYSILNPPLRTRTDISARLSKTPRNFPSSAGV